MATINTFDKSNLQSLRFAINMKLDDIAKEFGITLRLENISYSETEFTAKMKGTAAGNAEKQKADAAMMAKAYGLKTTENDKYVLVKYDSKKHKFPFIVKDKITGKQYKFTEDHAKLYFGTVA